MKVKGYLRKNKITHINAIRPFPPPVKSMTLPDQQTTTPHWKPVVYLSLSVTLLKIFHERKFKSRTTKTTPIADNCMGTCNSVLSTQSVIDAHV